MPKGSSFSMPRRGDYVEIASLILIGCLLTGYALLSKGFAYIGKSPLFVGEVVLSLVTFCFIIRPSFRKPNLSPIHVGIMVFAAICLMQTIPYIETYGMLSLRDSVIYVYSLFALIIGSLMARQDRMQALLSWYEGVSRIVIILSPLVILVMLTRDHITSSRDFPLIFQKSGDLSVQLAGAAVFRLVGLGPRPRGRSGPLRQVMDIAFWSCWLACATWAAVSSRGGMLSMAVGLAVALFSGYGRRMTLLAGGGVIALMMILGAFQVSVRGHTAREISMDQLLANSLSIVGNVGVSSDSRVDVVGLQGTAAWRLRWWGRIVDDTFSTPHFWTGRGFGVNLATADGFQGDPHESLRSPHNIHMTVLARAGIPGLLAWLFLLGAIAWGLMTQARRMRRMRHHGWHALNTWILCYWLASTVNATFDVYLEGPQGGIWWWSIVGLAIAAITIEKRARPAPESAPASS